MHRGVLGVGAGARLLGRLPQIVVEFQFAAPRQAVRLVCRAGGW
jgi:hypothetical protein